MEFIVLERNSQSLTLLFINSHSQSNIPKRVWVATCHDTMQLLGCWQMWDSTNLSVAQVSDAAHRTGAPPLIHQRADAHFTMSFGNNCVLQGVSAHLSHEMCTWTPKPSPVAPDKDLTVSNCSTDRELKKLPHLQKIYLHNVCGLLWQVGKIIRVERRVWLISGCLQAHTNMHHTAKPNFNTRDKLNITKLVHTRGLYRKICTASFLGTFRTNTPRIINLISSPAAAAHQDHRIVREVINLIIIQYQINPYRNSAICISLYEYSRKLNTRIHD